MRATRYEDYHSTGSQCNAISWVYIKRTVKYLPLYRFLVHSNYKTHTSFALYVIISALVTHRPYAFVCSAEAERERQKTHQKSCYITVQLIAYSQNSIIMCAENGRRDDKTDCNVENRKKIIGCPSDIYAKTLVNKILSHLHNKAVEESTKGTQCKV